MLGNDDEAMETSQLFNMESLRVWVGVLSAAFCCLSIGNHSLHPRLANGEADQLGKIYNVLVVI